MPTMSDGDGVCCEALRELSRKYPDILECSTSLISMRDGVFLPPTWIMHLYRLTESSRVSRRTRHYTLMNFCPFCGKRLSKPPEGLEGLAGET